MPLVMEKVIGRIIMHKGVPTAEQIIEAALNIAERSSWEELRLFDIAQHLQTELIYIHTYFREKDEIIDAFFDRADKSMLETAAESETLQLNSQQRLHQLLMSWFKAIEKHRRVAREMIWGKLEPGHLHIQLPALMRISRTVQWWREAAHRSASYLQRALEETVLTAIYITTFIYWLYDESKDATATDRFLEKRLAQARGIALLCKPFFKHYHKVLA